MQDQGIRDGTTHTLIVGEIVGGMYTGGATPSPNGRAWVGDNYCSTHNGINGPTSEPGGGYLGAYLAGFASFHPGGCHFVMASGSVQFITQDIAQVVLEAITYANRAREILGAIDYTLMDTLAADYAEAGLFAEAVRWQTMAVGQAPAAGKAELQACLELYKVGKPYWQQAVD